MFSALGCEDLLVNLISWVRKIFPGHLVIFDGKRGDIGNTAKHYAIESFERYEADATTVSPYMGMESIMPFWKIEIMEFMFSAKQAILALT